MDERRRTPRTRAWNVLVLMLLMVLVPAGVTSAADGDVRVELVGAGGVTSPVVGPLFDEPNLEPGRAVDRTVRVTNDSPETAELVLDVTEVRQADEGCTEPELERGDVTCGAGEGELQDEVVATVTVHGTSRYSGPLADLEGVQVTQEDLAPGGQVDVTLAMVLPSEANDLVQSDWVEFDLRWTLGSSETQLPGIETEEPETRVLGTKTGQDGPGTGVPGSRQGGALARTGATLIPLLAIGIGMTAGGVLLVGARRRRDS